DERLFEGPAVQAVHRFSGGIPRLINNICDNSLLTAFALATYRVTESIVAGVVEELDLGPMELARPQTIAETARHGADTSEENQHGRAAASNVRYIRRDSVAPAATSGSAPTGSTRAAIEGGSAGF